jgi:hypothetical protein
MSPTIPSWNPSAGVIVVYVSIVSSGQAAVTHDLALAVESLLMAHGKEIIEKQFHQERLANAAVDIYLSICTLSRATAALEAAGGDEATSASDLDCARLFVAAAGRRSRRAVRALSRNQDARLKAVAERALESGSL